MGLGPVPLLLVSFAEKGRPITGLSPRASDVLLSPCAPAPSSGLLPCLLSGPLLPAGLPLALGPQGHGGARQDPGCNRRLTLPRLSHAAQAGTAVTSACLAKVTAAAGPLRHVPRTDAGPQPWGHKAPNSGCIVALPGWGLWDGNSMAAGAREPRCVCLHVCGSTGMRPHTEWPCAGCARMSSTSVPWTALLAQPSETSGQCLTHLALMPRREAMPRLL